MEAIITLVRFARLSNRSYSSQVLGLIKRGPQQIEEFKTLCANAVARTIETNDTTHINRMVEASLACGRYRTFARVVPGLVPFAFDKTERVFSGKRQQGKYAQLMADHTFEDGTVGRKFEALLVEYFEKENTFAKTTPNKSWDLQEAVLRLVKLAQKNGKSFDEVNAAVKQAERELAA
jgi:hypothetical protein